MSLDPRLGHLYHDNVASIDAKEQLRMREINAREQRYLAHDTYVLDRARNICEKSRMWEQKIVKRQINKIRDRTMSLETSLKQEAKRVAAFNHDKKIVTSAPSFVSRTSVFAEIPREVKSAPDLMSSSRTLTKSNGFKQRSRPVLRSLLKIYNRSDERRRLSEKNSFKLDRAQIDALQKARVVLRGTDAEAEVSRLLDTNGGTSRTVFGGGVPRYRNALTTGTTTDFITQVNGNGGDLTVDDDDKILSEGSSVTSVTWTRFNKLPELWKQECGPSELT